VRGTCQHSSQISEARGALRENDRQFEKKENVPVIKKE